MFWALFRAGCLMARGLVRPRINNIDSTISPLSYILIILSVDAGCSTGRCWALYRPLCTSLIDLSPIGIDILLYWLL